MLVQEVLEENKDLIKTYSDADKYIINQDGVKYCEAVDPKEYIDNGARSYVESEESLPTKEDIEALFSK